MKSIAVIAALLTCVASASDVAVESVPRIRVFGTATTEVVPDQLEWWIKIREIAPDVGPLADLHTKNVEAVLEYLKTAGTAEGSVQTSDMALGPNREYQGGQYVSRGYVAETSIAFRTTDFSRYKDLWVGLVRLEGVSIERVGYTSSKRIRIQNETRVSALEAARNKAVQMAGALGAEIGEPLLIEEEPDVSPFYSGNYNRNSIESSDGGSENGLAIAPGKVPVTIRVSVAFRLISRKGDG